MNKKILFSIILTLVLLNGCTRYTKQCIDYEKRIVCEKQKVMLIIPVNYSVSSIPFKTQSTGITTIEVYEVENITEHFWTDPICIKEKSVYDCKGYVYYLI